MKSVGALPGRVVIAMAGIVLGHCLGLASIAGASIFDDDWLPPPATAAPPPGPSSPRPTSGTASPEPASSDSPAPQPSETADARPASSTLQTPHLPSAAQTELKPIPAPQELTKVRVLFETVYAAQLADPSPMGKKALAEQLMADAGKTTDAPTDQFVMLSGARHAAVDAGDVQAAFRADDTLTRTFSVDPVRSRLELVGRLQKTTHSPSAMTALARGAMRAADDAAAKNQLDVAQQLADAALVAAKASNSAAVIARAQARVLDAQAAAAAYTQARSALAALAHNPRDAAANLTVGRFYCILLNDWAGGLKHLALGSDAGLRSAAAADLAGADATAIARQWGDLAAHETGAARKNLLLHAAMWYGKAAGSLSGLAKLRAERELASLGAAPFRAEPRVVKFPPEVDSDVFLSHSSGFAVLGSISGKYEGTGEAAGVRYSDEGTWTSGFLSHQESMGGAVILYPRSDGLPLDAEVKEYAWKPGQPKVKMIRRGEGYCFLSQVSGHFEGAGERVGLKIGADGFWYLDCASGQADMQVRAISVKPRTPHLFSAEFHESLWKRGMQPIQLIRDDEGMCFLTLLNGGMRGSGEFAGLKLGDDGMWTLQGSGQVLAVGAVVVRYLPEEK